MKLLVGLIETLLIVLLLFRGGRAASEARSPYGRRLLLIAVLLVAQAIVLYFFEYRILPSAWADRTGTLYGLVWLTQAVRLALLLPAFGLWVGIIRPELTNRWRWAALIWGLAALGWGGEVLPSFGVFLLLAWLSSRLVWSRELVGWRRAAGLLIAPLVLAILTLFPASPAGDGGGITTRIVAASNVWPPPLIMGTVPPGVRLELDLARPLDRAVQALVDLFRIQLVVLTLQMLTLPIRLSGMSLKRRFMLNYVLVRQIPAFLAAVLMVVGGYLAFGLLKAGQARATFERTLARASAVGAALLADPLVASGGAQAPTRLAGAREWLGSDGARAHVLLRSFDVALATDTTGADSLPLPAPVIASTPDAPAALTSASLPRTRDGRAEGMIEAGEVLYLVSRSTAAAPPPGRAVDVWVPMDSLYLGALARRVDAPVQLLLERAVSVASEGVTFGSDTSVRSSAVIAKSGSAGPQLRSRWNILLARSFLPLGDWRSGWRLGSRGTVSLELRTAPYWIVRSITDLPGWLFANVFVAALLLGLMLLVSTTEGLAVRSGRTIVQAVEDEVAQLRKATEKFGAGDLAHRVPVRGRDELSMLADSFNEMAANLERQRAELLEKERIEEDLEVARQIQRRFLPQSSPRVAGLEVAGISKPSREVGGDLFYYAELPGERLALALGDVSGKSVSAALLMSNVMSALRAELLHETEVAKSLQRINRLIVEQVEPGRFVTLFYGMAEPAAGRLRYTSAGHNPALHLSASGAVRWLSEGGVPLGVLPESEYPSAETPFEPGDLVLIYSDGVTEAEGGGRDGAVELFGEDRLVEVVRGLRAEDAEGVVRGVLAAVERFASGRPQTDDITLVAVRRT